MSVENDYNFLVTLLESVYGRSATEFEKDYISRGVSLGYSEQLKYILSNIKNATT